MSVDYLRHVREYLAALPPVYGGYVDSYEPIEPRMFALARETGQWGTWPTTRSVMAQCGGLRLHPGKTSEVWSPCVWQNHQAMTRATTPAYLVPMKAYQSFMRSPEFWGPTTNKMLETWAKERDGAVAAHRAMGGSGSLEALDALIRDDALRCVNSRVNHVVVDFVALTRLDPSPEHIVARHYIDQTIGQLQGPHPLPVGTGPWRGSAAATAYASCKAKWSRRNRKQAPPDMVEATPEQKVRAAWELLQVAPQYDTNVSREPGSLEHINGVGGAVSDALIRDAAKDLVGAPAPETEAWRESPWWRGVEAVANGSREAPLRYMEAAEIFDGQGNGEAAWDCLQAAAYWGWLRAKTAIPVTFQAAKALARAYEWTDIAWALDDLDEQAQKA